MNNNQIKKNLLAKEKIEMDADSPQKMRDARPATLASLFNVLGGSCIGCQGYISYPVMEFYGFAVEKFQCRECQQKENTNQERKYGEVRRDDEAFSEEMVYSKRQNQEVLFEYNLK